MSDTQNTPISPLMRPFPDMPHIEGVTIRSVEAGYAYKDRADLTLFTFCENTVVAGVTTQSLCASPEVILCREHLQEGKARALIVNAGNSNAFTGAAGKAATDMMIELAMGALSCPAEEIFISSTGVIGVPLPKDKAKAGLTKVFEAPEISLRDAAKSIGTTDTFPKGATASAVIGDKTVHLTGIIKGSGMIAPDMATMLGYIFTDAAISANFLQQLLDHYNKNSFSCITVDSDTSTSDTVLAFATGQAGNNVLTSLSDKGADAFAAAFEQICRELAQLVVRDGEGASKFITINVHNAHSDDSARNIGLSIANSPLVKTAIAGEDANWGRVVMAVGKAGEPADRDRLGIAFGGIAVAENGMVAGSYDEDRVNAHLKKSEIELRVDIGLGEGHAEIWTCDLTHGYISINADYRS